jgi:hypothetical protein
MNILYVITPLEYLLTNKSISQISQKKLFPKVPFIHTACVTPFLFERQEIFIISVIDCLARRPSKQDVVMGIGKGILPGQGYWY